MNEEITKNLQQLKEELNKLAPAVKHLHIADENATMLIEALINIKDEFSKYLDNIETAIVNLNDEHLQKVSIEINRLTDELGKAIEKLTNSNDSFKKEIKALLEKYSHLAGKTTELIEKIGTIDFPNRLEKLDTTVSSINLGLQNTQTSIRDFERNLRDDVKSIDKSLRGKLEETTKLFKDEITKQANELKLLKILLFSSLGLSVLLVILSLI